MKRVRRHVQALHSRGRLSPASLVNRTAFQKGMAKKQKLAGGSGFVTFVRVERFKNGRKRVRKLVLKRYHFGSYAERRERARQEFIMLNALRKIPALQPHIPPTVRFIPGTPKKVAPGLLLTDLTHNGKYRVLADNELFSLRGAKIGHENKAFYWNGIQGLREIARKNGFNVTLDSFMVQFDAQMKPVKIWIVDAGGISRI